MKQIDRVKVNLRILENSYQLVCEPHENNLLIEAAELFNKNLQTLRDKNPKLPFDRLVVMGGLQMSFDLLKERQTLFSDAATVNRISTHLIEALQAVPVDDQKPSDSK